MKAICAGVRRGAAFHLILPGRCGSAVIEPPLLRAQLQARIFFMPLHSGLVPPDCADAVAEGKERGTHEPLPGLKMDTQNVNCEPEDAEAVRRSLKASRAWSDAAVPGARWLRDGYR